MIFYSVERNLVVNSKKTNKIIARFKDGKFKTKDPVVIERLKPIFKHTDKEKVDYTKFRYMKLKSMAAKKKLYKVGMKRFDIITALRRSDVKC